MNERERGTSVGDDTDNHHSVQDANPLHAALAPRIQHLKDKVREHRRVAREQ
jgi:hypothetical protein